MCHLVPRIDSPGSRGAAARLADSFAGNHSVRPERRLQALINLYNTAVDHASKYYILMKTIEFSRLSGLADIMLGVIRSNIDSWITALQLSKEEARSLYMASAHALRSCTRKPKTAAKEAYRLQLRALHTFDESSASEGVEVAVAVVNQFVSSSELFTFDYLSNPAIQALKNTKDHADVFEMLTLNLTGTMAEFTSFMEKKGDATVAALGMTKEAAIAKMQLLALIGLIGNRTVVSFEEISESLRLTIDDVEDLIVKAIGKNLLDAKIDQLKGVVMVSRCASRKFDGVEWERLLKDIQGWRAALKDVSTMGTDRQAILTKGFAQLQAYT